MGESRKDALRVNFDKKLKPEFHGTKVTSDVGLLAYRQLDEVLGLTKTAILLLKKRENSFEFVVLISCLDDRCCILDTLYASRYTC